MLLARVLAGICAGWDRVCALGFLLLVALVPFAHASLPDPVWLPGVYDGGDYDDEVTLLTDTPGTGDSRSLADEPSHLVVSSCWSALLQLSPARRSSVFISDLPQAPDRSQSVVRAWTGAPDSPTERTLDVSV
jgi:hypothetical protein